MPFEGPEKLLNAFAAATGVSISFFNRHFGCVADSMPGIPDYCAHLHRSKRCIDCCTQSDMAALRQVEQTGKPYRYICPFGMMEAIAPIVEGDEITGYLMIGSIALPGQEQEETLLRLARERDARADVAVLRAHIRTLPRCDKARFDACCDLMTVLAAHFAREVIDRGDERTVVALLKDYLKKNLQKKITLAELGMRMHCSTVTLTKAFRRETGTSIMQYLQEKRLQYAKKLLSETNMPIKEVAERCGFAEPPYFSRCFKREFGVSPKDCRRSE